MFYVGFVRVLFLVVFGFYLGFMCLPFLGSNLGSIGVLFGFDLL